MPSDGSKAVKKEEVEDEGVEKSARNRRLKPDSTTPKSGSSKDTKVKKEEAKVKKEEAEDDFEETPAKKTSNKTDKLQKKKKTKKEQEKKKGAKKNEENGKKREKKVYDLPGQKRDPPEERDPLRIFYETLHNQVPNSEIAAIWMMESGLLSKEEAKKVYEKKLKTSQKHKLSSPMKAVVTVKKNAESVTVKRNASSSRVSTQKKNTADSKVGLKRSKKRKIDDSASDDGSDDDFSVADRKTKKQRAA